MRLTSKFKYSSFCIDYSVTPRTWWIPSVEKADYRAGATVRLVRFQQDHFSRQQPHFCQYIKFTNSAARPADRYKATWPQSRHSYSGAETKKKGQPYCACVLNAEEGSGGDANTGLDYWTHPNCKIQLVQYRTEAKLSLT